MSHGKIICLDRARAARAAAPAAPTEAGAAPTDGAALALVAAIEEWETRVDQELHPLVDHSDLAELIADAPDRAHPLVRYLMGMAGAIPPAGVAAEDIRADLPAAEIREKLGTDADPFLHGYADGVEFNEWVRRAREIEAAPAAAPAPAP